jgi:hypothetical protein
MLGNDAAAYANQYFFSKIPGSQLIDFLFPASSNKLETVGHFAIEGAMGRRLDAHPIVSHAMLN